MKALKLTCILACIAGCHSERNDGRHGVPEAGLQGETVLESIEIRFPGSIAVQDTLLVMLSVIPAWVGAEGTPDDAFIHIYNTADGTELGRAGQLGEGPEEFLDPDIAHIRDDHLVIHEMFRNRLGYFSIDRILNDEDALLYVDANELYEGFLQHVPVDDKHFVGVHFGSSPFSLVHISAGTVEEFGRYPVAEEVVNTPEVFQGSVQYNPDRKVLGYTTNSTGYMALYTYGGNGFSLTWEKEFHSPQYRITDNTFQYSDEQLVGFSGFAFTKDYVVGLTIDGLKINERTSAPEHIPDTFYVLDYEGNLLRKYHLDIPLIRIQADVQSNTIYGVAVDPDYSFIRYDLDAAETHD